MSAPDPWLDLRRLTAARIALGRSGVSLPTAEWLRFAQAHAMARDAVHSGLDAVALLDVLVADTGLPGGRVHSAAADRQDYLRRPDLGRRLAAGSRQALSAWPSVARDVVVVIGDGLSPVAAATHALPLVRSLATLLPTQGQRIDAVLVAEQARVALGDEIGAMLGAAAVLMLIGERPGLSSPDSLGAYLTWAPRPGRSDAERNCVSNIRPEGQPIDEAAKRLAWLIGAARRLGATGVVLKDESDRPALEAAGATPGLARPASV
ncbi:MAG: ethanolamine ammonia-lyase subunit EutC [Rubrivivax sp.]